MNGEVWLGTVESAYAHQAYLKQLQDINVVKALADSGKDEDDFANPVGYEVTDNGIAVLSVKGNTLKETTKYSRYFGLVSYQDIRERIVEAADDTAVKMILMNIDSTGGHASGTKPLSVFIREVSDKVKPVVSYTDGYMASAALWYGTAAKAVIADEDAALGSVGALLIHMEYVEALKKEGISATVFRTSPFKALGNPYEPLSDKAKAEITKNLMITHDKFVSGLSTNRGLSPSTVNSTIANGKVFTAAESLEFKLIDNVMSYDETVARLSKALDNPK